MPRLDTAVQCRVTLTNRLLHRRSVLETKSKHNTIVNVHNCVYWFRTQHSCDEVEGDRGMRDHAVGTSCVAVVPGTLVSSAYGPLPSSSGGHLDRRRSGTLSRARVALRFFPSAATNSLTCGRSMSARNSEGAVSSVAGCAWRQSGGTSGHGSARGSEPRSTRSASSG